MYSAAAKQLSKSAQQQSRVRQFWRLYRKVKRVVGVIYDASAVLVVLLSFDRVFKLKSWRVLKPWQIASLIERMPKLFRTLQHSFTYGI